MSSVFSADWTPCSWRALGRHEASGIFEDVEEPFRVEDKVVLGLGGGVTIPCPCNLPTTCLTVL